MGEVRRSFCVGFDTGSHFRVIARFKTYKDAYELLALILNFTDNHEGTYKKIYIMQQLF